MKMAGFLLLLLVSSSLPLLSEAQLSLLGPKGRPPFSFTLKKDDTPSPQRAMESDIAAIFRAAAYGTTTTTAATTSTTRSTSTTSKPLMKMEIKKPSTEIPSDNIDIVTTTMPSPAAYPGIDLSKSKNIEDLQHNQDIIEMKSFIAMEENYRREHSRDEFKNKFSSKVSTTERIVFGTSDNSNHNLQNMESAESSELLSWGRIYIGVGLVVAILTLVLILLMKYSYNKYQSKKHSSISTVCGGSHIFSSYSLKPELQGMSVDPLEKGYFSLGMNTDKNNRTFNNYGQTKTMQNKNKPGHLFINSTDSSMLVHDSGFVRIKTDTEYENLKNGQICKPVLNKYHSVPPHPANPYSYCESRHNSYYCVPQNQNGFIQISQNKPLSPTRPMHNQTTVNNQCESTVYSDIYSHPSEFFNQAELPLNQGLQCEAPADQFRTGFMQRLGRTTANTSGYGYSPLEGADISFGSEEEPQIV